MNELHIADNLMKKTLIPLRVVSEIPLRAVRSNFKSDKSFSVYMLATKGFVQETTTQIDK